MPSIGERLFDNAEYNPNGLAIIYGNERITWRQLNGRVNRLANALSALGVKKGDKGIVMFHDSPWFIESNYALQKIGAIPVPMNTRFVAKDIEYQTNDSDSIIFIFEDLYMDEVDKAIPNLKKVKNYICRGKEISGDFLDYERMIGEQPSREPEVDVRDDDICVISYTGGTTGLPKGVVLQYSNFWNLLGPFLYGVTKSLLPSLVENPDIMIGSKLSAVVPIPGIPGLLDNYSIRRLLGSPFIPEIVRELVSQIVYRPTISPRLSRALGSVAPNLIPIKWLFYMPLFHGANWQALPMAAAAGGLLCMVISTKPSFDPIEALEIIEREKVHVTSMVPTQWKKIVDLSDTVINRYNRSSLIVVGGGAGVMPADRKKKVLDIFPNAIAYADVYGMTEMSPDTTVKADINKDKIKERCIGKPMVETRIVNEEGNDAGVGEIGEIIFRSPTMMKEYYKDAKKTADAIRDGWFYSGDLGYFDEDGDIRVLERKKECISSGGEKIYPAEVEEILSTHPKIEQVCIIGIPDETWGEAVRAVVQLKEGASATENEIIDWCRGKITGFKKPKSVVFGKDLPLTAVGKIQRGKIKEKYGGR